MTDEDALLAAVIAAPDDDTPRLVYADWLDEHGQPDRAEFIRVQIERSTLPEADPRWRSLRSREVELLLAMKEGWLRPYLLLSGWTGLFIYRGIVEIMVSSAAQVVQHISWLHETTAHTELRLWDTGPPDTFAEQYCEISLAPRPAGQRVRAVVGDHESMKEFVRCGIDLLPAAPGEVEPALTVGEWVVLVWAAEDPNERRALGRLIDHLRGRGGGRGPDGLDRQFAARPYYSADEFAAWCPLASFGTGPHWLRLRGGRLVDHETGLDLPPGWVD